MKIRKVAKQKECSKILPRVDKALHKGKIETRN